MRPELASFLPQMIVLTSNLRSKSSKRCQLQKEAWLHSLKRLFHPCCWLSTCAVFPGELNLPQHFSHSTFAQTAARVCRCTSGLLSWIGVMNLCLGLGVMEGRKTRHLKHPTKINTGLSWYMPPLFFFNFSFLVVVENVRGVIELESRVVEGFNIN